MKFNYSESRLHEQRHKDERDEITSLPFIHKEHKHTRKVNDIKKLLMTRHKKRSALFSWLNKNYAVDIFAFITEN